MSKLERQRRAELLECDSNISSFDSSWLWKPAIDNINRYPVPSWPVFSPLAAYNVRSPRPIRIIGNALLRTSQLSQQMSRKICRGDEETKYKSCTVLTARAPFSRSALAWNQIRAGIKQRHLSKQHTAAGQVGWGSLMQKLEWVLVYLTHRISKRMNIIQRKSGLMLLPR